MPHVTVQQLLGGCPLIVGDNPAQTAAVDLNNPTLAEGPWK